MDYLLPTAHSDENVARVTNKDGLFLKEPCVFNGIRS